MESQSHLSRGLLWLGSGSLAAKIIDALTLLVVLWFLTRDEMGLATLAWSVTVFVEAFNGLGMHPALVQADELSEREIDSAFWYVTALAVILTGLAMLAAPWIAAFYGSPELIPMVRVSATKLLFVGGALVPLALLSREFRFEHVAAITTVATLLASAVTIVLAMMDYGAWAPLLGNTAHGMFQLLGVYAVRPHRPRMRFHLQALRGRIAFGIRAGVANVIYELYRNVDYLIVGRVLGLSVLGVYRVAFDLAMAPALAVVQVVNRTALPVFSRMASERADLARAFNWTTRSLGLLLAPIVVVLFFGAEDLLLMVGRQEWRDGADALALLAWVALLRAFAHIFPQLLYARGRPDLAVLEAVFNILLLVTALVLCLMWFGDSLGLMAPCIAWLACCPIMFAFEWMLATRVISLSPRAYLEALRDPLLGTALLLLALGSLGLVGSLPVGGIGFGLHVLVVLVVYGLFLRFVLGVSIRRLVRGEQVRMNEAQTVE